MRADHETHRQRLPGCRGRLVDRAQIARGNEIDAGLAPAAQHQAAHADIGEAGARIDHEIDRRRDVRAAIGAMAEMHRQRGEIGLIAREDDLLRRAPRYETPRTPPACCAAGAGSPPPARAARPRTRGPAAFGRRQRWQRVPAAPDPQRGTVRRAHFLPAPARCLRDRAVRRGFRVRPESRLSTNRRKRKRSKSAVADGVRAGAFSTMPISDDALWGGL